MLDWAAPNGIGFSAVVSIGGACDVDFGEAIDYLATDPKTEHILLYIEGVRDARRFLSSVRAAARSKPVILIKVGRHPVGSRAAVSHTGALIGLDDVFDAAVRRSGAVRVASLGQLVAAADALAAHVRPGGDRLAIITNAGGPGVMAADRAADLGVPLASLSPGTIERLRPALPANWSHGNPIDVIGDAGPERYRAAVAACLADEAVDGLLVMLTPQAMTDALAAARAVIEASRGVAKPLIACWMGEASTMEARVLLEAAGIPTFRTPEPAVEVFANVSAFYRNQRLLMQAPPPLTQRKPPDLAAARALIDAALASNHMLLSGAESKRLLAAFHVAVAPTRLARSAEEAVAEATALGYPVAMKIASPDITHKTDVGGVRLNLAGESEVRAAYAAMRQDVAARLPAAGIEGVTLEPMVVKPHGRELVAGLVQDPVFGPAVAFGSGGTAVEVHRDRAVALPPLNPFLATEMIGATRVSRMLGAFRGMPPVDRAALEEVLLRLSEMACELPEISELDVNPLVADETGAVALDARVVLRPRPASQAARYAHMAIHPYPAYLERELQLADGSALKLRPIRPEDAQMEIAFVDRLSEASRYFRFMGALRELTPAMLARFTQIDYDREMALVALSATSTAEEEEVGVARYVINPDGISAEFAIVVADDWQGRGLGSRLLQALAEVAKMRGLRSLVGYVLAQNGAMLGLVSRLGFRVEADPHDPGIRRAVLDLTGT
jgi:acetyltransferase